MHRLKLILTTLCIAAISIIGSQIFAQSTTQGGGSQLIDIKANLVYPHKINDTLSVLCLVGEFAAQHNGAVITADSAVRFENDRLECYGDVLINKNTTYAYADEMVYDGLTSEASLFAPIIKVVDEDITMYTYNFTFNTMENVGEYWGDGLTIKTDIDDEGVETQSVMESNRGYYFADAKQVVGVDDVEFSSDEYLMQGDSVSYDMDRDIAYFYEQTNIWSGESDYIYGDEGRYDRTKELCVVVKNGYLLTAEQEAWSDSMEYYTALEEAILRNNIQIDDTTNKSLIFGDFAQYWGGMENVLVTRDPAMVSYDTTEGTDTLFLRGDTIFLRSRFVERPIIADSLASDSLTLDMLNALTNTPLDSLSTEDVEAAIAAAAESESGIGTDSLLMGLDSLALLDSATMAMMALAEEFEPKEPTKSELKKQERAEKLAEKRKLKQIEEHNRLIERQAKLERRIEERLEREKSIYSDSMVLIRVTNMLHADSINWGFIQPDSLLLDTMGLVDSTLLVEDLLIDGADSLTTVAEPQDSTYRTVFVYGNTKVYRTDVQMVCDSLIAQSIDTTMQLYIDPIMWSGSNQIASQEMKFYTKGGNLDYADFIGDPIMSAEIFEGDTLYYNQVSGKLMTSYFEDNTIVQNDVDGNVETIYFMQDEQTLEVTTIAKIESGDASFYIENQLLTGITYRSNPEYVIAPLDKMPVDVKLYLDNFAWYGNMRPTRKSIFNRTIRPTLREVKGNLMRPSFPIRARIDKDRELFTESEEWRDRTEGVSDAATEWMKSLGFTPGEPRPDDMQF